eukprot:gene9992-7874_t
MAALSRQLCLSDLADLFLGLPASCLALYPDQEPAQGEGRQMDARWPWGDESLRQAATRLAEADAADASCAHMYSEVQTQDQTQDRTQDQNRDQSQDQIQDQDQALQVGQASDLGTSTRHKHKGWLPCPQQGTCDLACQLATRLTNLTALAAHHQAHVSGTTGHARQAADVATTDELEALGGRRQLLEMRSSIMIYVIVFSCVVGVVLIAFVIFWFCFLPKELKDDLFGKTTKASGHGVVTASAGRGMDEGGARSTRQAEPEDVEMAVQGHTGEKAAIGVGAGVAGAAAVGAGAYALASGKSKDGSEAGDESKDGSEAGGEAAADGAEPGDADGAEAAAYASPSGEAAGPVAGDTVMSGGIEGAGEGHKMESGSGMSLDIPGHAMPGSSLGESSKPTLSPYTSHAGTNPSGFSGTSPTAAATASWAASGGSSFHSSAGNLSTPTKGRIPAPGLDSSPGLLSMRSNNSRSGIPRAEGGASADPSPSTGEGSMSRTHAAKSKLSGGAADSDPMHYTPQSMRSSSKDMGLQQQMYSSKYPAKQVSPGTGAWHSPTNSTSARSVGGSSASSGLNPDGSRIPWKLISPFPNLIGNPLASVHGPGSSSSREPSYVIPNLRDSGASSSHDHRAPVASAGIIADIEAREAHAAELRYSTTSGEASSRASGVSATSGEQPKTKSPKKRSSVHPAPMPE